jgi:hypothetical protein
VKYLLQNLQDICNELKDAEEIAIIKTCGNNSKRFTLIVSRKKIFLDTDISYTTRSKINYDDRT